MSQPKKRLSFYDAEKIEKINEQTMFYWKRYKIDMELRELSERTQLGYYNDLLHWWLYVYDNQENRSVCDLTEDDLTEFFYYCKKGGNSSRRMKRRMASISAFYKFLRKKKYIQENPMEFIDRPSKDVDVAVQTFLTKEQVAEMRNQLQNCIINSESDYRRHFWMTVRCYVLFSLSTMARVNAVSNTRWDQIDLDERIVSGVIEKEGYIVDLYFSKEIADLLLELREFRTANGINDNGFVFTTKNGEAYDKASTGTLTSWCKKVGALIDVPTLHPHDFRHSGATLLKNSGMSLEDVSKLLNHKSTDVTNKFYIKEDKTVIKNAKDRFEVF